MTAAAITGQLTGWIADHGAYAVFGLMALDALLPVGSELVMLYAGVLAAGAISDRHVTLLGAGLHPGIESYVALALAGALGYLLGALVGWGIGVAGGRPLVERHGRRLHLGPDTLRRAEDWFERFGPRAVLFGRVTPVVRSFISIPAGVFRMRLAAYTILTLLGSAIWCFALAGAGWAVGRSWERFHSDFRFVDYAVALAVVATVAWVVLRWRSARLARRAADTAR